MVVLGPKQKAFVYVVETLTNLGMCAKNLCLEAPMGVMSSVERIQQLWTIILYTTT